MVIKGHFSNGVIVLDEPVSLPEGALVNVLAESSAPPQPKNPAGPTILDLFSDLVGKAENLPADAAENIDHYLYGLPKVR